jgi:hypothetical protein
MSFEGHVQNGVIVLEGAETLAEGTKVRVEVVASPNDEKPLPTLYERLQPIIGAARGLPPDLAEQHDHYIHGTPKK